MFGNKKREMIHRAVVCEGERILFLPIYSIDNGMIETDRMMLRTDDAKVYYDEDSGGMVFTYGLEYDSRVQAERLKDLENQVVLGKIFDYEIEESRHWSDTLKWMFPYILLALAIMFLGGN